MLPCVCRFRRRIFDPTSQLALPAVSARRPAEELAAPSTTERWRRTWEALTLEQKNCTLYETWDNVLESGPVRKHTGEDGAIVNLRLHECDHWAEPADVRAMVVQLTTRKKRAGKLENRARSLVKYMSNPTGSGKTKSVLHAFLASNDPEFRDATRRFTHYVYIAFGNNDGRHFKLYPSIPSDDPALAEMQGRAFIYDCIESALCEPGKKSVGGVMIPRVDDVEECKAKNLTELIHRCLGPDSRVLIHIDEHQKMCSRLTTRTTQQRVALDDNVRGAMTVVELKDKLRSRGLRLGGKKAELVERLSAAIAAEAVATPSEVTSAVRAPASAPSPSPSPNRNSAPSPAKRCATCHAKHALAMHAALARHSPDTRHAMRIPRVPCLPCVPCVPSSRRVRAVH